MIAFAKPVARERSDCEFCCCAAPVPNGIEVTISGCEPITSLGHAALLNLGLQMAW